MKVAGLNPDQIIEGERQFVLRRVVSAGEHQQSGPEGIGTNGAGNSRRKKGFLRWVWHNFLSEVLPFVCDRKKVLWLEKDLASQDIEVIKPKALVQIRVVESPGDELVAALKKAVETGWGDSSFVSETLRKGGKCYVAMDNHSIVSYQWVTAGVATAGELYLGEVDCRPVLRDGMFYFFKAYTFPQYRGYRIIGALITAAMRDFKGRSYGTACTAVRYDNAPSLQALARMGFVQCRLIRRYRVFKLFNFHLQNRLSPCTASIRLRALSLRAGLLSRSGGGEAAGTHAPQ